MALDKTKRGHRIMSVQDAPLAGGLTIYPTAGGAGTTGGGTSSNASTTNTDSILVDAGREAIIYSIHCCPTAANGLAYLENHDGTQVYGAIRTGTGSLMLDFGPEGLRVPDFRLRMPAQASQTTFHVAVVFDVE
jgi:hypothetical protein